MISLNMWNIKYDTNEFIHKTKTDSHTQKTSLQLPKEKTGRERINKEFGTSRYKQLYIKQINNVGLLYSTGHTQYPITIMEKKKNTYIIRFLEK